MLLFAYNMLLAEKNRWIKMLFLLVLVLVVFRMDPERRDKIKAHADGQGESVNGFINIQGLTVSDEAEDDAFL